MTKAGGNGDRVGGRPDREDACADQVGWRDRKKRWGENLGEGMMTYAVADNRMVAMENSLVAIDDMNMATDGRKGRIEPIQVLHSALVKKCEKMRENAISEIKPEFLE